MRVLSPLEPAQLKVDQNHGMLLITTYPSPPDTKTHVGAVTSHQPAECIAMTQRISPVAVSTLCASQR